MSFKKTIIIASVLMAFFKINAQKLELGKVTIAELAEKEYPGDPSAAAAILFEKGNVRYDYTQSDGFKMITTVSAKIKIYKKEGYEWANKVVEYYSLGSNNENVSFSDAATYNLVDGKIVKTKLKSDGEFDEKVNKYYSNSKITMPGVKEGSIIEYEYVISSPRIWTFMDWQFQKSIPVNYSEFKTYVPEYFIYNANQKGFIFPKTTVEKAFRKISYTYRDANEPGGTIIHSASNEQLEFTETQTTYIAEKLPAMRTENFVNNIDNYTSAVTHELSIVKWPNAPIKTYATDWATVTKTIYKSDDFGGELQKTGYFEPVIDALIKGLPTKDEKIAAIFNYVKANVKWNGYNSYYCDGGVKKALKDKTGNIAEINLMLTAMLRHAQIDANPVLVSTRKNGIALFPNLTAFNYVISAVEVEDKLILLDAAEKFSQPNILPLRDLNWNGRLIRKDGTSAEVDLMPRTLSKEINYMSVVLKADGSSEGKIRKQYTDHEALDFRQLYFGGNKETYLEELENDNNAIEISDYTRENETDLSKPVLEAYSFKDSKGAEII
ncbi:MAG TPA: DUF3857 domain-containing protein, partial [Flavobacterium sp.]|nr:DUF3857 domain-containing protein [Flavobacterium sp.]